MARISKYIIKLKTKKTKKGETHPFFLRKIIQLSFNLSYRDFSYLPADGTW